MAITKTTTSTNWVHIENYWGWGVNFYVRNPGSVEADVQFREVVWTEHKWPPGGYAARPLLAYMEIWFKSQAGAATTIETGWLLPGAEAGAPNASAPSLTDQEKTEVRKHMDALRSIFAKE